MFQSGVIFLLAKEFPSSPGGMYLILVDPFWFYLSEKLFHQYFFFPCSALKITPLSPRVIFVGKFLSLFLCMQCIFPHLLILIFSSLIMMCLGDLFFFR